MRCLARLHRDERGSTIPLILGFFLIALMFTAAAVTASDAFTRQRDLQSICDGAATAAASSADFAAIRGGSAADGSAPLSAGSLPLGDVQNAVDQYLARDPARGKVSASAQTSAGQDQVTVQCSVQSRLAFGALFGHSQGITQRTSASARARLG